MFKLTSLLYLGLVGLVLASLLTPFLIWGLSGRDHFGAIPLDQDTSYYRTNGSWLRSEIQDRDIFYHGIGKSIEHARQADIVILGHSMVMWALSDDLVREFEKKHGVKIYNLGFAGIASGEFVRRIIQRWNIKPKMWVINADDQAASFFNDKLDDFGPFGNSLASHVVKYGRLGSEIRVSGRNLRWNIEQVLDQILPESMSPNFKSQIWRNIETGNWYLEKLARYTNPQNSLIKVTRDQDCHAKPEELSYAQQYVQELGGKTVLTLIPYEHFCPQRVREIAQALKLETIIPTKTDYSTADKGQHLDKKGALMFTNYFLAQLEKTQAFKAVLKEKAAAQA